MERLRQYGRYALAPVLCFSFGLRAQTGASFREGVVIATPRAVLSVGLSATQPTQVTPATICAGRNVTLRPPAGTTFPEPGPGMRVLFSPCGVPGNVIRWAPDAILVTVPAEAEDGPVWLAAGVSDQAGAELGRGAACLRSIADHTVVPERPATYCDPKVGDLFDPQLKTKLRGTPASDASLKRPAPPVFRANERGAGDPPACIVAEPDRRGPLTFGKAPKQFEIATNTGDHGTCFESCEQVRVSNNFLKVQHAPRVESFLPAVSEVRGPRQHRVERGPNRVNWRVVSDAGPAGLLLARDAGAFSAVPLVSSSDLNISAVTRLTLSGSNACGNTELTISMEPATTLRLVPERIDLNPGVATDVRVTIAAPLPQSIDVAIDNSAVGMVRVTPAIVTIPAGSTEVRAQVELTGRPVSRSAQVGQLTARLATAPDWIPPVLDSPNPSRLYPSPVRPDPPPPPVSPAPDQVLVQGRLRYRECMGETVSPIVLAPSGGPYTLDSERCLMDGTTPVFKPVRRARVEVWDQAPIINQLRSVVDTDDTGFFQALVPASGSYDVTVVASSIAGQVNLENDAITWFWRPLRLRQDGVGGGTLNYNFDFARAEARHFNALDAITRGLEYALARSGVAEADADATFRRTVVIPGTFSAGVTLQVGNATHIWVGAMNQIFIDDVVLHEYGHHMQHANNTYRLWGAVHNGCYATAVVGPACLGREQAAGTPDSGPDSGCWVNSPQYAWFEGFPTYFANMVLNFDANHALTRTTAHSSPFAPGPQSCPLLTSLVPHLNHLNEPITGAAIEDHVSGAFMRLRNVEPSVLTPAETEEAVFRIFVTKLRDRAPTVFDFRDAWRDTFGDNPSWLNVMRFFGM